MKTMQLKWPAVNYKPSSGNEQLISMISGNKNQKFILP
jgi:hypothetical protein